jgi:hypothetical protein
VTPVADVLGHHAREPDSSDQRSKRIRGTPRGHAAGKAIREIVQELEAEWEQQLGPRKFTQLCDPLAQLYAITAAPVKTGRKVDHLRRLKSVPRVCRSAPVGD